jgi:hypothetical protein
VWQSGSGTLLDPGGTAVGEVLVVSPDGTMVAGTWNTVDANRRPVGTGFYWTAQGGVAFVGTLPNPQVLDRVWLEAISANNKLIFGAAGDPYWSVDTAGSEEFAVVWTQANGLRKLQDVVAAQNIAVPAGYHLTAAVAASADGTVVFGVATDMNDPGLKQHSFILHMPVSAYCL